MTMTSNLRRAGDLIRRGKFRLLVARVFRACIYSRHVFIMLEQELPVFVKNNPRKRTWKCAIIQNEVEIEAFRKHFPNKVEDARRLFRSGVVIAFCSVDGHIVACSFHTANEYYEKSIDHKFIPENGQVYEFGWNVLPKYRRTLVVQDVVDVAWQYLHRLGYRTLLFGVDQENLSAWRLFSRYGFTESGLEIRYWRVLFFRRKKFIRYQGSKYPEKSRVWKNVDRNSQAVTR